MEKRVKSYSNTKLLDHGMDRLYYTAHRQHLNSAGKEVIMNKLAVLIRDIQYLLRISSSQSTYHGLSQWMDLTRIKELWKNWN